MEAHPDQGFVRLALPLLMAWAGMKLSPALRSVLDCLAIECWGFGRKGYECELTGAEIARRVGITKRGANKALDELERRELISRDGRRITLVPVVPVEVRGQVNAWYGRLRGTGVPLAPENATQGGTAVPEKGTAVPPRTNKERARAEKDLKQSSYTPNSLKQPASGVLDDDAKRRLKGLAHALAETVHGRGGPDVPALLAELRQVAGTPAELAQAMAQVLLALDANQSLRPRSLRQLVAHAMHNPEQYPQASPDEVLLAYERLRESRNAEAEQRRRRDAALAADLRRISAGGLATRENPGGQG